MSNSTSNPYISKTDTDIYKVIILPVRGEQWRFSQFISTRHHSGNYVSVSKITNNPFRKLFGKEFKTFDEACENYKSGDMKAALLLAEVTLRDLQ